MMVRRNPTIIKALDIIMTLVKPKTCIKAVPNGAAIATETNSKLSDIEKSDIVQPKPWVIGTINIPGVPIAADEKNKARKASKAMNQL